MTGWWNLHLTLYVQLTFNPTFQLTRYTFVACTHIFGLMLTVLLRLFTEETTAKTGMILVCGEISSKANVDTQRIVRECIKHIGYDDCSKGIERAIM